MSDSKDSSKFDQKLEQHDPLCPFTFPRAEDPRCHMCDRLAKARADERERVTVEITSLLDALEDVLVQATTGPGDGWNTMDSMALSAYADGIRTLDKYGRVKIEHEAGRRVIADRRHRSVLKEERDE